MNKLILIAFLLFSLLNALTIDEFSFCLDREFFDVLSRHNDEITGYLEGSVDELGLVTEYALRIGNDGLFQTALSRMSNHQNTLSEILSWVNAAERAGRDSLAQSTLSLLHFADHADQSLLDYYRGTLDRNAFLDVIGSMNQNSEAIENIAKQEVDEIGILSEDSLALALCDRFSKTFPDSKWHPIAYYYRLYHLSKLEQYGPLFDECCLGLARCNAESYLAALYLLNPEFRKHLPETEGKVALTQARSTLIALRANTQSTKSVLLLYDNLTPSEWESRLDLSILKADYYALIENLAFSPGENSRNGRASIRGRAYSRLLADSQRIRFPHNDRGDQAELLYWQARILALDDNRAILHKAASTFVQSLVLGSPRRRYDQACLDELQKLHKKLGVPIALGEWMRQLTHYRGIVFELHPFEPGRLTRIAIGDYDNNGFPDLLLNGNRLFRNDEGRSFTDVSEEFNLRGVNSVGGLWGDFNRDGYLDIVTISHASDGAGEALLKNHNGVRFVKVNERAGDIDDRSPTEGAALVDMDKQGYPSLYCANYEKWQERSGYPDYFWYNSLGYFQDHSVSCGFRYPPYTDIPGLAGRGVAPADYDNDGDQEILVTNYRLDRNFCWDSQDNRMVDKAARDGIAGDYKFGYYGHSIGADWGDFDNDGDLDLFIANLAHPRYVDISDISKLLRNDGSDFRVIGADTLRFWRFTDITKNAGISYDELHSDPLWFDADNDGFLDLFITSVYENDRSYLYRNNGNGTFTDITWLANARLFNGWGNATADLDRDGLPDLVVGSGNGARILMNRTPTANGSIWLKPVWREEKVDVCPTPARHPEYPNSPAFGTRIELKVKNPDGSVTTLARELSSAKGTCSQNAQELHFGLGSGSLLEYRIINYEKD